MVDKSYVAKLGGFSGNIGNSIEIYRKYAKQAGQSAGHHKHHRDVAAYAGDEETADLYSCLADCLLDAEDAFEEAVELAESIRQRYILLSK